MNEIAVVTEQDIPDILRMIHEIYSELPNKEWFSLDSDEEVTSYMMTGGFGLSGPARAVIEMAGIKNIRTKSLGSNNKQNVVLATIEGLRQIKTPEEVAKLRGKSVEEIFG